MKRCIAIIMMLITLFCSSVFAVLIDTNREVFYDDTLIYTDLQFPALDDRGRYIYDRETKKQLFKYHPAINEIMKATKIGFVDGYDEPENDKKVFKPEASITKAEFIKLAIILSTNRNFDFSAIPITLKHWAAPYVAVAEMQNVVVKGEYNDSNLNEPITRIEMICILSKIQINMKGVSQYREAELPNYTDIDSLTEEEKGLLLHAARYELMPDMFTSNTIRPFDNLTRSDATVAIMRIY